MYRNAPHTVGSVYHPLPRLKGNTKLYYRRKSSFGIYARTHTHTHIHTAAYIIKARCKGRFQENKMLLYFPRRIIHNTVRVIYPGADENAILIYQLNIFSSPVIDTSCVRLNINDHLQLLFLRRNGNWKSFWSRSISLCTCAHIT